MITHVVVGVDVEALEVWTEEATGAPVVGCEEWAVGPESLHLSSIMRQTFHRWLSCLPNVQVTTKFWSASQLTSQDLSSV